VLATLAAAPFLFGVLLAVALGGYMTLQFAPDMVRGLRASSAPRRMCAA
jgi:gas vesicle protein